MLSLLICIAFSKQLTFYVDFSGPLMAIVDGRTTVVGVTSLLKLQVFARVTSALQWILDITDAADWQC